MNTDKKDKILAWFFLFLAIVAEIVSTGLLKMSAISEGKERIYSYIFIVVFITISYYLMALAIKKIQVGIAYAMWEVLGSIFIILMSLFIFNEILTLKQSIGIVLAITGIILINIGEVKEK